jgi:formate C-acetyltransferase
MNIIHYMHDKWHASGSMALHDYAPLRTMAFGMAGMSVVADSLSAIKFATVRSSATRPASSPISRPMGRSVLGNNDNRVDHLAAWVVRPS